MPTWLEQAERLESDGARCFRKAAELRVRHEQANELNDVYQLVELASGSLRRAQDEADLAKKNWASLVARLLPGRAEPPEGGT